MTRVPRRDAPEAGIARRIAGRVILGSDVTLSDALSRGWAVTIPWYALVGGFGAALLIGALVGMYPAMRAAKMAPTEALRAV